MATCYNPSLSEEPRNQPMKVVPLKPKESLIGWLENSGRFQSDAVESEPSHHEVAETLEDILEPEAYALENEEE